MKTCLSIAGSDCSGGAGIQADLKTFAAHRVYGMSVITALTAQNTLGVSAIKGIEAEFVSQQLDAIFSDIPPDAIKIGMLTNHEIINTVDHALTQHQTDVVVLDPVMVATSGHSLLHESAVSSLFEKLIPHAHLITPNLAELVALGQAIGIPNCREPDSQETLLALSEALYSALPKHVSGGRVSILSKGGHLLGNEATDVLIEDGQAHWFTAPRVDTSNTHGTGCTLSSAIAAQLALGLSLQEACDTSKQYVQRALQAGLNLGRGSGPLCHHV